MKIEAPCRIGGRFTCEKPWHIHRRFYLTGLSFFYWESQIFPGVTLGGKNDPKNAKENTAFFRPDDVLEGVAVEFEVPDKLFIPGCPLREMGMNTDAVGHLQGLNLCEEGWEYYVYYGKSYGGPMTRIRTDVLDKLFDPVLPLRAVQVNLKNYLL